MSDTRKKEIIMATLELAANKGLGNVSMNMIADKVGIKKPSLYNHFASKEELVEAMYQFLREEAKKNASVSAEKKSSSGQSASSRTTQNASIAASADEETLLAALVQCEAGGTSVQCMTAVGAVVVNRVRSGGFANSIYGVIYQRGQFGPASSGRLEARLASGVSASARQAARAALNGSDPTGGAKYFKLASSGHAGTVVGPIVFY